MAGFVVELRAAEGDFRPAAVGLDGADKLLTLRGVVFEELLPLALGTAATLFGDAAHAGDVLGAEGILHAETADVVGYAGTAGCLVAEFGGVGVPIEAACGVG